MEFMIKHHPHDTSSRGRDALLPGYDLLTRLAGFNASMTGSSASPNSPPTSTSWKSAAERQSQVRAKRAYPSISVIGSDPTQSRCTAHSERQGE